MKSPERWKGFEPEAALPRRIDESMTGAGHFCDSGAAIAQITIFSG